MNILLLHRDFPGQFKYLLWALSKIPNNRIVFITENNNVEIPNIEKIVYKPLKNKVKKDTAVERYNNIISNARAATKAIVKLKNDGFEPDIIYGFNPWGLHLFVKDIYPNAKLISYCEWFFNSKGADIDFDDSIFDYEELGELRCKNSHMLVDLYSSDSCICPTQWQKQQFPKEFQDKIKVIHDGIDTNKCKPNKDAEFKIDDKLTLTTDSEVLTYATRGMEAYRGFPQFMRAASRLLKQRPNLHIVVGGVDRVYYGQQLENTTYKELMLKELDFDMSRLHFVGALSFNDYINLLQISSVHVYLTYPFVLSWSLLNAMSTGCCVVASNTNPVTEVIKDSYNGFLTDFFDVDNLVKKIEYTLDNKEKTQSIRDNARKTIIDKYDLKVVLPQHIDYINELIKRN